MDDVFFPDRCHGGIFGRSVSTALGRLEHQFAKQKEVLFCIDYAKCFDHIWPQLACRQVARSGIPFVGDVVEALELIALASFQAPQILFRSMTRFRKTPCVADAKAVAAEKVFKDFPNLRMFKRKKSGRAICNFFSRAAAKAGVNIVPFVVKSEAGNVAYCAKLAPPRPFFFQEDTELSC